MKEPSARAPESDRVALPLIQQREIEAKIVGPLVEAFSAKWGEEAVGAILAEVIQAMARHAGCLAAQVLGGKDLEHLASAVDAWRAGDALTLEVLRSDAEALEFNVTRCGFAEMYRRLGLEKWGAILSCNRDAAMVEGFNPAIHFERTQTLMQGASHCDFRYRIE